MSFYFCYDRTGSPVAALAEVTNTFREMKPYYLGPADRAADGDSFRRRTPKDFYVSPYSNVDIAFDFNLRAPGARLLAQIDDYRGSERTLTSTVAGERRELTGARLAWWTLKYPLLTLRVIALIHRHALRLWLKRLPWFAKAARYLPEFCRVVGRTLKPGGTMALQFITCPDSRYDEFRRGVDFIQKHIFPGSLLLSLNRVNGLLANAGQFMLHGLEDLGPDYARTLHQWRDNFGENLAEVRDLGFDEPFIRKWNYYLCYCEAAFALRNISVVQAVYARPNNFAWS